MKKETVTEEKVINTPAGGVLIGKDKEGQTIIPNDGSLGGFLTGRLHKDGGIKAVVKSTGQPIEMQANEIVITAPAVADTTKRNFQGKMMTNREILSKINVDGGGLAFADGGEMPSSFKPKGKKYTYGGKLMSDSDILKEINDCGCEHGEDDKKKMKYGGNLSKGMTLGDIANRHNVSLKHINEQLLIGIEKEKEHGGTKAERIAIAKDHLVENPNYYTLVQKAGLEAGGAFNSKPFLDYYHSEIAEFLKDQNDIKLNDDFTFSYRGEKFTIEPMVLVDKESDESIKKANFVITDSEDQEVGEINFDSSKKKKFAAYSQFFEWNPIRDSYFEDGGKLSRKQDLVKDAKNGNSPSRDLNNYNDIVDVQEDSIVGNHVDFPEQGASGTAVAFADGGDISFLDDVDTIFDQGGSTGGSEKPNVFNVTIVKTHPTTAGIDFYKELFEKSFYDWTSLKTELRMVFKEQGKFIGAFTIQINDNQKAKIFIKFADKKNTVANFNPLTGAFSDFKKQALRNQPTTFNAFDWNNFQSSNNKEQQPNTQGSENNNTPSSTKPVLESVHFFSESASPRSKDKELTSLSKLYVALLKNSEPTLKYFDVTFKLEGGELFSKNLWFRNQGVADDDTFITKGINFEDFKKFFLQLPVNKNGEMGLLGDLVNADKFISGGAGAKAGEAKSSDKEVVQSLMVYEILGSQKDWKDIAGLPRFEIDTFYSSLKEFAEKNKDAYSVRVNINASVSETHGFSIIINKTSGLTHFDFETKNLDDFKKHILTRINYENYKELKEDFDFTSFFGEESEQPSGETKQSSEATSPFKDILELVEVRNSMTFPKLKGEKIKSLSKLYEFLLENSQPFLQHFYTFFKVGNNKNFIDDIWFRTEGVADDETFITKGTNFEDFKKFFLQLPVNKNGEMGLLGDLVNADKFIGEQSKNEKTPLKYVDFLDADGEIKLSDIYDLQIEVNSLVRKDEKLQVFILHLNGNSSDELTFFARKTGSQDDDTFVTTGKTTDDFIKFFTNLSLKKGGKLTDKFNIDTFLGIGKVNRISYAFNKKDRQVNSGFVNSSKEFLEKVKEAWDTGLKTDDDACLFAATPVVENVQRVALAGVVYISNKPQGNAITFNPEKESLKDLENLLQNKWVGNSGSKNNEKLDWSEFFGTKADEQSKANEEPTEKAKEESKPQEVSDFELERKYLFSRINALSKELDFKRPSLTNEEVGFYSREINKLILKLRKVTEKQESLKPLSDRLKAIYSVKWGEYSKEYPETTLLSVNGSKSQLTESEYQTVRNFEFKSFFGDWEKAYLENNPASASQIINPETREPLAVFHGTDTLFTDWKTYATNNAHYFSKKRSFAEWFASSWEARSDKAGVDSRALKQLNPNRGRFVYRCFLDIRKPVDFSRFGVEKRPVKEFLMFLKINYGIGDYDFWTGLGSASAVTAETQVYAWQIIRLWQNFTMYIKAYTTYDGYIFYEYNPDTPSGGLDNASLCFCAFESSQVKFADAYEFSALSNDSRFNFGGEI